ncbi:MULTISPECIES: hypothetical protein [Sphingobacterium]|uniref:hypothetical protein n=1 Tax=Sphingobacterium TaxID=28453 RepID=UPI0013DC509E|nr:MULTISPECIES: hypothetical protein [unclassified Sphingobacterium]
MMSIYDTIFSLTGPTVIDPPGIDTVVTEYVGFFEYLVSLADKLADDRLIER